MKSKNKVLRKNGLRNRKEKGECGVIVTTGGESFKKGDIWYNSTFISVKKCLSKLGSKD